MLLLFQSKGKIPIYGWQRCVEGQGTKFRAVAFMLFLMILRFDQGIALFLFKLMLSIFHYVLHKRLGNSLEQELNSQ